MLKGTKPNSCQFLSNHSVTEKQTTSLQHLRSGWQQDWFPHLQKTESVSWKDSGWQSGSRVERSRTLCGSPCFIGIPTAPASCSPRLSTSPSNVVHPKVGAGPAPPHTPSKVRRCPVSVWNPVTVKAHWRPSHSSAADILPRHCLSPSLSPSIARQGWGSRCPGYRSFFF